METNQKANLTIQVILFVLPAPNFYKKTNNINIILFLTASLECVSSTSRTHFSNFPRTQEINYLSFHHSTQQMARELKESILQVIKCPPPPPPPRYKDCEKGHPAAATLRSNLSQHGAAACKQR